MEKQLINVQYGSHERNRMDVYFPDSGNQLRPAILFLHGGGYVGGDKSAINDTYSFLKKLCLDAGITVVSANYRFIKTDPFPAPMNDGTRAIQYIRHKSGEWMIDPERIALAGSSAGAHISLWNAMKGDLSDPASQDPVERQRSSVKAAVVFESQASKDQHFYKAYYAGTKIQPHITRFYGISSVEELETPEVRKRSWEASAINFVSASAPPVLLSYRQPFISPTIPVDTPVGEIIHHPVHGYALQRKMEQYGVECIFRHANEPLREGEIIGFLRRHLNLPENS